MATAKPGDKNEPARVPRSGHGTASLIPHLQSGHALVQPEAAESASAPETQLPQAQGTAADAPPQAE
jgi:hypothetical protein